MPTPAEKLAQSLEVLGRLQQAESKAAIRAKDLSRTHRERLIANGFLREVIKGWYIPSRPEEISGESTPLVCVLLEILCGLFERTLRRCLVPFTRTVNLVSRW